MVADRAARVYRVLTGRGQRGCMPGTVVGYGTSLITYVLAPPGDIAWSTVTTSAGRHGAFLHVGTIHRVIGQTVTTLDAGPYVRATSLRLHGATVEWTDRGNQRSAPLP